MARPLLERFSEKYSVAPNGCWIWGASLNDAGYGWFQVGSSRAESECRLAHRVAWELFRGPIPDGMCVLHDCPDGDNPACVNPSHLWIGTQAENNKDCHRKGRNWFANNPGIRRRGSEHGMAKLTEGKVVELREAHRKGATFHGMARETGISRHAISLAVKGITWRHVV